MGLGPRQLPGPRAEPVPARPLLRPQVRLLQPLHDHQHRRGRLRRLHRRPVYAVGGPRRDHPGPPAAHRLHRRRNPGPAQAPPLRADLHHSCPHLPQLAFHRGGGRRGGHPVLHRRRAPRVQGPHRHGPHPRQRRHPVPRPPRDPRGRARRRGRERHPPRGPYRTGTGPARPVHRPDHGIRRTDAGDLAPQRRRAGRPAAHHHQHLLPHRAAGRLVLQDRRLPVHVAARAVRATTTPARSSSTTATSRRGPSATRSPAVAATPRRCSPSTACPCWASV